MLKSGFFFRKQANGSKKRSSTKGGKLADNPKTFKLVRSVDVSGISGTGSIAEGIVFHDKQTVLSWFGRIHSIEVFPCLENVLEIHGHGGATKIEWD